MGISTASSPTTTAHGTGSTSCGPSADARRNLPFVLFTDTGSEGIASAAIPAGVTAYMWRDAEMGRYPIPANRIRTAVERHRAEREHEERLTELRRNERRLDAIFEDPKMLVGVLSPDGRLRKANHTAMRFVDAHGWSVSVTGSEAGGTRFEITGVECESQAPTPN